MNRIDFISAVLDLFEHHKSKVGCYGSFAHGTAHYDSISKISHSDLDLYSQKFMTKAEKHDLIKVFQSEIIETTGLALRISIRNNPACRVKPESTLSVTLARFDFAKSLHSATDEGQRCYSLVKYFLKRHFGQTYFSQNFSAGELTSLGLDHELALLLYRTKLGLVPSTVEVWHLVLTYLHSVHEEDFDLATNRLGNRKSILKFVSGLLPKIQPYQSAIPGIYDDYREFVAQLN